jgi:hypothetical protein
MASFFIHDFSPRIFTNFSVQLVFISGQKISMNLHEFLVFLSQSRKGTQSLYDILSSSIPHTLKSSVPFFLGGRFGYAVGLSAISLLPTLAKDAASIPNA